MFSSCILRVSGRSGRAANLGQASSRLAFVRAFDTPSSKQTFQSTSEQWRGPASYARPISVFSIPSCNPHHPQLSRGLSLSSQEDQDNSPRGEGGIFADPDVTFESIGIKSPVLLQRIEALGLIQPTAVQAATFSLLAPPSDDTPVGDVIIGSETGSGKSLAYLLPLIDDILIRKQKQKDEGDEDGDSLLGYQYARALILVPNKELVQQVVRMAIGVSGGKASLAWAGSNASIRDVLDQTLGDHFDDDDGEDEHTLIRIAIMPGGLKEPNDFQPFRSAASGATDPVDLVISTPAAVGPLGLNPKNINMFADIQTLVVDECDMCLDGGYIKALEQVLLGFRRADKLDENFGVPKSQHVFVAATLPDFGLRSVDAYLQRKFPRATRVAMDGMHNARHFGLSAPTVWIEEETKRQRVNHLTELLETPTTEGGLQGQKVMVFVNSVDDVENVDRVLRTEGVNCSPYHAKMKLSDRTQTLDRFRRYSSGDSQSNGKDDAVQILVCTDLASRGLDVPNVDVVVQLQFAGNVVAHLHRMGRCGRAGQRTGRGIVYHTAQERELVLVVQAAENEQEQMILEGDVLESEVMNEDETAETVPVGSVKNAFSRKRGFTKRRKKERRETQQ